MADISRKTFAEKKQKKKIELTPEQKANKRFIKKVDVDALPDAIIGDKLVEGAKQFILRRERASKPIVSLCTLVKVTDDGFVTLNDETLGQTFMFQLGVDKPCLKICQAN